MRESAREPLRTLAAARNATATLFIFSFRIMNDLCAKQVAKQNVSRMVINFILLKNPFFKLENGLYSEPNSTGCS